MTLGESLLAAIRPFLKSSDPSTADAGDGIVARAQSAISEVLLEQARAWADWQRDVFAFSSDTYRFTPGTKFFVVVRRPR